MDYPARSGCSTNAAQPNSFLLALALAAALLSAGFVVVATYRQLNFDEWLILRSGWLLQNHPQSELHFLMPYTWLSGILSDQFSPTSCILTLRLLTAVSVIGSLVWAFRQVTRDALTALIAMLLCMTSGVFVSHAFEFRYDAVILCCWICAWGLLSNNSTNRYGALGIIAGVLACHHLKGLFFAAGLTAIVLLKSIPAQRKGILAFTVCAGSIVLIWTICLVSLGLVHEQQAFYSQFLALGGQDTGVGPIKALTPRLAADAWWWTLVIGCCLFLVWRWRKPTKTDLAFSGAAAVPILFIALHPRPWDYMLAPVIPFFAAGAASGLLQLWNRVKFLISSSNMTICLKRLAICIFTAQCLFMPLTGISGYLRACETTYRDEALVLTNYRKIAKKSDTVLDPTGALYFVTPFDNAWYLDTLFIPALQAGKWMARTIERGDQATIVVNSYRKNWLAPEVRERLKETHEPTCGWLWLRKGDPRIEQLRRSCSSEPPRVLTNYWGY